MECYMPTVRLNGHHAVQIYEKNLPLDLNGHSQRLWLRARLQFQERLRWSHCVFSRIACYREGGARMLRGVARIRRTPDYFCPALTADGKLDGAPK
jgi:hypothetical protein